MQEHNAIIEHIWTSTERGFTAGMELSYGGSSFQSFGDYLLYAPTGWKAHSSKGNYAGHWFYMCCKVAGVERWEDLKGKAIRVRREDGFNGRVLAIGHIIEDIWFEPAADFKNLGAEE